MALIKPDLSEIKEDVAPGEYHVRVTGAELGEWAGKEGKPPTKFVKWQLETVNEAEAKNNGRRIWHATPYTGGGAFRLSNFFKAATGEALTAESSFDTEMIMGRELMVTVDTNDKGYIEVRAEKSV